MKLTPGQREALIALEKIQQGNLSAFLRWDDADELVEMGLAKCHAKGEYKITEKGLKVFRQLEGLGRKK